MKKTLILTVFILFLINISYSQEPSPHGPMTGIQGDSSIVGMEGREYFSTEKDAANAFLNAYTGSSMSDSREYRTAINNDGIGYYMDTLYTGNGSDVNMSTAGNTTAFAHTHGSYTPGYAGTNDFSSYDVAFANETGTNSYLTGTNGAASMYSPDNGTGSTDGEFDMGYRDDLPSDPNDPEEIPDNDEYNETH